MERKLTEKQFADLPIHDAWLLDLRITQEPNGDFVTLIDMKAVGDQHDANRDWHRADSLIRLAFKGCRLIATNFIGGSADRDSFYKFDILKQSEFLKKAGKWPSTLSESVRHYHLLLNTGSTIDLVTEAVFVEYKNG